MLYCPYSDLSMSHLLQIGIKEMLFPRYYMHSDICISLIYNATFPRVNEMWFWCSLILTVIASRYEVKRDRSKWIGNINDEVNCKISVNLRQTATNDLS